MYTKQVTEVKLKAVKNWQSHPTARYDERLAYGMKRPILWPHCSLNEHSTYQYLNLAQFHQEYLSA